MTVANCRLAFYRPFECGFEQNIGAGLSQSHKRRYRGVSRIGCLPGSHLMQSSEAFGGETTNQAAFAEFAGRRPANRRITVPAQSQQKVRCFGVPTLAIDMGERHTDEAIAMGDESPQRRQIKDREDRGPRFSGFPPGMIHSLAELPRGSSHLNAAQGVEGIANDFRRTVVERMHQSRRVRIAFFGRVGGQVEERDPEGPSGDAARTEFAFRGLQQVTVRAALKRLETH